MSLDLKSNFDESYLLSVKLVDELKDSSSEEEDSERTYETQSIECFRCGRDGHYANTCYAKKHIQGYILS